MLLRFSAVFLEPISPGSALVDERLIRENARKPVLVCVRSERFEGILMEWRVRFQESNLQVACI
ncbi:MAG: hypothetical protein OXE93_05740 [bacterium]|nr:hypothetical protein [bacterium]